MAVWSWNTAISLVCGNPVLWKPSEKTPLTAVACTALLRQLLEDEPELHGLAQVVIGDHNLARVLTDDVRLPLVSATGSTRMGREVGPRVAARFGRSLLELGGNNAMIVGALGRPGPGPAGHRVLGRRHRRAALHDAAPPDRPPVPCTTSWSSR